MYRNSTEDKDKRGGNWYTSVQHPFPDWEVLGQGMLCYFLGTVILECLAWFYSGIVGVRGSLIIAQLPSSEFPAHRKFNSREIENRCGARKCFSTDIKTQKPAIFFTTLPHMGSTSRCLCPHKLWNQPCKYVGRHITCRLIWGSLLL